MFCLMQEDDTFPVKCLLGHFQAHWVRINTRSFGGQTRACDLRCCFHYEVTNWDLIRGSFNFFPCIFEVSARTCGAMLRAGKVHGAREVHGMGWILTWNMLKVERRKCDAVLNVRQSCHVFGIYLTYNIFLENGRCFKCKDCMIAEAPEERLLLKWCRTSIPDSLFQPSRTSSGLTSSISHDISWHSGRGFQLRRRGSPDPGVPQVPRNMRCTWVNRYEMFSGCKI